MTLSAQAAASEAPVAPLDPMQEVMRVDLFGGYSFQKLNSAAWRNQPEWVGPLDLQFNFGRSFALVTAFSAAYGSQLGADLKLYTILTGPRLTFRTQRGNIFVHALGGEALLNASAPSGVRDQQSRPCNGSRRRCRSEAYAPHLASGFSADYLMTQIAGNTQNNYRVSTGWSIASVRRGSATSAIGVAARWLSPLLLVVSTSKK